MEFEYEPKIEEIAKDKEDWTLTNGGTDDTKYEEKPRKVDPDGKCDLKFEILTKFFQRVNDTKGKKKSEFVVKFFQEFLFPKDRKHAFAYLRLILPHVRILSTFLSNSDSLIEKEEVTVSRKSLWEGS